MDELGKINKPKKNQHYPQGNALLADALISKASMVQTVQSTSCSHGEGLAPCSDGM